MTEANEKLNEIIERMSHPQTMDMGGEHKDFLTRDLEVNCIQNNTLSKLYAAVNVSRVARLFPSLPGAISNCVTNFMANGGLARTDAKQAISNRWAGQKTEPITILEKMSGKKKE